MKNANSDHVHASSGEVFAHGRVVIGTTLSGSLVVLNLLLIWVLTKADFTDHVKHGQELMGLHLVVGTRNLVDVCTNEVATAKSLALF